MTPPQTALTAQRQADDRLGQGSDLLAGTHIMTKDLAS
jgi:hypothetical protein